MAVVCLWSRIPLRAQASLVPVTIEGDPILRNGNIYVRKSNGPWKQEGTFVGFPGHDKLMLENHGHYEIKIESPHFWTIDWGSVTYQPVQENSPQGLVVRIRASATPESNTWNVVLKLVAPLLLLGIVLAVRFLRRGRNPQYHDLPKATRNNVEVTLVNDRIIAQSGAKLPSTLKIGRYQIEELIGEGGMASVYRVRDEDGMLYAMKIPHKTAFEDPTFMQRFQREISICITFQHPHIIRAFDEGTYDPGDATEVPYLVMELASGVTLDNYLMERSHNGLAPDLEFGVYASKGIAEALAAAHDRGIVHRDIKPGNVIVTDEKRVKVMDFGIARSQRAMTMALTSVGGALGTPAYMAPEQVSTSRPVDHRADLYALGVLMYSLFTYKVPFWDENVGSMVLRKLTEEPPSMRTENPEVSRGLDAIVLKLLERSPDMRFQSAIQVLAALEYLDRFPDRIPPGLEAVAARLDPT